MTPLFLPQPSAQRKTSLLAYLLALLVFFPYIFTKPHVNSIISYALFAQAPSQPTAQAPRNNKNLVSFVTLTNTFLEKASRPTTSAPTNNLTTNHEQTETVFIPQTLYEKRNKKIWSRRTGKTVEIYVTTNTLLKIDLTQFHPHAMLVYRKRFYTQTFYTFIKTQPRTFRLQTSFSSFLEHSTDNSSQNPTPNDVNNLTALPQEIKVLLDNVPSDVIPILPATALSLAATPPTPRHATPVKTPPAAHYIFPPQSSLLLAFQDAHTAPQAANLTLTSPLHNQGEKTYDALSYTLTFPPFSNAQTSTLTAACLPARQTQPTTPTPEEASTAHHCKLPLPYEHNYIELTVDDVLGNRTSLNLVVTLDKNPPTLKLYYHTAAVATQLSGLKRLAAASLAFQDSLSLIWRAQDTYSKNLNIFIARLPYPAKNSLQAAQSPLLPQTLQATQPSKVTKGAKAPKAPTFQKLATFNSKKGINEKALRITESTLLYYYGEDHFGNKSQLKTLMLYKDPTPNLNTIIEAP